MYVLQEASSSEKYLATAIGPYISIDFNLC